MALSSYLEAKLLDLIFSNTAYTVPGTLYVSLGQQTAALTTALTAGTPVTSLACTGTTTHALANGDIVLIGTSGEQAVVSGTVNAGSTSITINSFTPCKSYATGTSIVKVSGPVEPAGNGYARGRPDEQRDELARCDRQQPGAEEQRHGHHVPAVDGLMVRQPARRLRHSRRPDGRQPAGGRLPRHTRDDRRCRATRELPGQPARHHTDVGGP